MISVSTTLGIPFKRPENRKVLSKNINSKRKSSMCRVSKTFLLPTLNLKPVLINLGSIKSGMSEEFEGIYFFKCVSVEHHFRLKYKGDKAIECHSL